VLHKRTLNGTSARKQSLWHLIADLLHVVSTAICCNVVSTSPVVRSCQSLRAVITLTALQQREYNALASQQV